MLYHLMTIYKKYHVKSDTQTEDMQYYNIITSAVFSGIFFVLVGPGKLLGLDAFSEFDFFNSGGGGESNSSAPF
jgi:hypothetical protein